MMEHNEVLILSHPIEEPVFSLRLALEILYAVDAFEAPERRQVLTFPCLYRSSCHSNSLAEMQVRFFECLKGAGSMINYDANEQNSRSHKPSKIAFISLPSTGISKTPKPTTKLFCLDDASSLVQVPS